MISKKNNCLTPLEMLKWYELQLTLVLIATKEVWSFPLEALEKPVDHSLGYIEQCQVQQESVTDVLYFCRPLLWLQEDGFVFFYSFVCK
jgi:hypothetical protein